MTYNKPTIEVLGEAVRVIHGPKISPATADGTPLGTVDPENPMAYDLDE